MNLYVSISLCFIPLIITIAIAHTVVPEFSSRNIFAGILAGLGAIVPVTILQYIIMPLPIYTNNTLPSVLFFSLIFNGLIEETIKMIFISFIPGKNRNFGIFLATAFIIGCSFGCFEAVIYFIAGQKEISIRLLTAVILHILCTGLSGIYVWTFKNGKGLLRAFIDAVLLHGIYNFFAGFSGIFWWFSIITILFAAIRCRIYYTQVKENHNFQSL
jgi:RsiW-degrading membrane proteinase PrsW (M82 family)